MNHGPLFGNVFVRLAFVIYHVLNVDIDFFHSFVSILGGELSVEHALLFSTEPQALYMLVLCSHELCAQPMSDTLCLQEI